MMDAVTSLPSEVEDWLITEQGIQQHGTKNIVRTALSIVCYYSVVAEQLLYLSNDSSASSSVLPAGAQAAAADTAAWQDAGKSAAAAHPPRSFPQYTAAARRMAALDKIERTLDKIDNSVPPALRVDSDLLFPQGTPEMQVFQSVRIAIIKVSPRAMTNHGQLGLIPRHPHYRTT